MKRLIFFFCILPQLLLAQLSNLSIQINDIAASASNKELTAQLTATADIQAGFLISLPAEIKMIPLAIEINQNNLALLNSDLNLQNIENEITGLVREKYTTYQKRMAKVKIEEENTATAEQNMELQKELYATGASDSLDFRDAQVLYARADAGLSARPRKPAAAALRAGHRAHQRPRGRAPAQRSC